MLIKDKTKKKTAAARKASTKKRKARKARAVVQAKRAAEVVAAATAANHTIDLEQRVATLEGFIRDSATTASFDYNKAGALLAVPVPTVVPVEQLMH